ncbi:MAG: hypothetical protein ACRDWS_06105 [Acidimicrobiia bacterium]
MDTSTITIGFICSAGCPEIVIGFWVLVGGGVALLLSLIGTVIYHVGRARSNPHLSEKGRAVENFGEKGLVVAGVMLFLVIAITVVATW